jgi:uncharacterized HAD superfamily protein
MNIAIDIDDSLADFLGQLILFHNEKYGTALKRADFNSCAYHEVWGGTATETNEKIREFGETDYFADIIPLPGSQETINSLKKKGHNLFVVTGRRTYLAEKTAAWIGIYFPEAFSGIYHTNAYALDGARIKKSQVCKDLDAKIIVDDDFKHITDCAGSDIKVLVYDSLWNQGELPKDAVRVSGWHEIIKVIDGL